MCSTKMISQIGSFPILWFILLGLASGAFIQYDMPDDDYYVPGDVNVGAVLSLSTIEQGVLCGSGIGKPYVQFAQSLIFAVDRINKDPTILPNITLGLVLLNDCLRERVALSQSTKFIKMLECARESCKDKRSGPGRRGQVYYDVVAQLAGYQSKYMVLVGALFSQHQQNVLAVSTSNELSDKTRFKYFTRTVPADSNRARAMVEVMDHYKWTYIATYGSQGSYGENGLAFIHKYAKEKGMCIAHTKVLPPDYTDEDYDQEIRIIRKVGNVRVLTFFLLHFHVEGMLNAIGRLNASAEFIVVSAEGFGFREAEHAQENGLNTISVLESIDKVREFYNYYIKMNPFNNRSRNPWFGEYTEEELQCTWTIPEGREGSCHNYKTFEDVPRFSLSHQANSFIDQVYVVAYAVENLVRDRCPAAFHDKSLLLSCVEGELLLQYIRNLSFQGMAFYVRFDERGDLVGKYDIMTSLKHGETYTLTKVGDWDMVTETIDLNYDQISFYHRQNGMVVESTDLPESVCAKPCKNRQFYIQGELKCCWECRYCRDNEIVRPDRQGCLTCEENSWPEPVNASICKPIPPTYMLWEDPIALGLQGLTSASVLTVVIITLIFYKHGERKVVKGSNKELMVIIQLGLLVAYGSVFAFITKPTKIACYVNFFGFNLSCTLIFGPLLIKTNRLYRIFTAAEKCRTNVKRVNMSTVLLMTFGIIFVQVLISTGVAVYDAPAAITQMPVKTEPHVELLCYLPLINLLTPLSFNLLLLLLCAVYGFLTRKLPDNFNESWYIFISVTTTLFVWIAFLPTYFLAFYSYHKAALLALALILNGGVTCLCLYAPKIYALYYIKEENIQVSSFDNTEFTNDGSRAK